jgi:hypothetical protein
MESYLIFWKKDKIDSILKNGDTGPLSVIYVGPASLSPRLVRLVSATLFFLSQWYPEHCTCLDAWQLTGLRARMII